ncbi:MAG: hypothetical protein WCA35_23255, partial [Kovacikia sp.]
MGKWSGWIPLPRCWVNAIVLILLMAGFQHLSGYLVDHQVADYDIPQVHLRPPTLCLAIRSLESAPYNPLPIPYTLYP